MFEVILAVLGLVYAPLAVQRYFFPRKRRKIALAMSLCGGGHLSRVARLLPALKMHGEVITIGGGRNENSPPAEGCDYEVGGLTFVYEANGVNWFKSIARVNKIGLFFDVFRVMWIIRKHQFGLLVNDFEPVTTWACRLNNIGSVFLPFFFHRVFTVYFGHHASFRSWRVPFPPFVGLIRRAMYGMSFRLISPVGRCLAFHFESFGVPWILPALIHQEFRNQEIRNDGHICVYFPAEPDFERLSEFLSKIPEVNFVVFSPRFKSESEPYQNVVLKPFSRSEFAKYLATSAGLLTSGGFQAPAEARYLGKAICAIPQIGQFEQFANAAALRHLGEFVIYNGLYDSLEEIRRWAVALSDYAPKARLTYEDGPDRLEQMVSALLQEIGF